MSDSTPQEMAPAFDPKPVEAKWGARWLEAEIGKPNRLPRENERPFVITIPPPNVTGVLHLGHALQHSIHDCLLRYHRMKGEPTLCIPGTDHAGIGTQIKVEAQLREEEGLSRHDLGRDEFVRRTQEWKDKYGGTIIEQMKALGCSYDWSRERYTMDEGYIKAVLTVFKEWFDRGLIYRGYRLVNWSSGAQTTVSDLEIETKEVTGNLTYIRYPIENSAEFVTVATTRPETMLGDTAVAVHPDDARYSHLRGKNVLLPLQNRAIPLVFDEAVSMEFGTGAVKITPAHDPSDYEMGQRHGLPMISVIGFDDKITSDGGAYAGMDKIAARKRIVEDLRALGLIEKVEPLTHSVPHCARTGVVIEPLLSEQWFVAMKELVRPVADAIRMNRVQYLPPRFANTSLEWLDNIRDWCISRQLWWGHRIPIWYGPNGEVKCSLEPIEGYTQDEDVLDTWFSSALWPFAVLGWPDNLEREWYPTSVLITGRDILNLWVSRMITTSLDFIETERGHAEIPFHDVFVHPTVQDVFGLRMSKSLGTGIDPMELISIYGADATRYGLLQLATGAQDVRFIDAAESKLGEDAVRRFMRENRGKPLPLEWADKDGKPTERYPQMQSARNFANKIWNAARFVLTANPGAFDGQLPSDLASRWIASRLSATVSEVTRALNAYEFENAASALYAFIWNDFCDWFLEVSKPQLRAGDANHAAFMAHILEVSMRLLHPFMPFISEEIWAKLPHEGDSLALSSWPVAGIVEPQIEADFSLIQDAIRAARNLRAQAQIPPGKKLNVTFVALNDGANSVLNENNAVLTQLANLESASVVFGAFERPQNAVSAQLSEFEVILPLEGLIDVEAERAKLSKQLETARKDVEKISAKLSNENFTAKAPREVVEKEESKRAELTSQIEKLSERLAAL
ncbi:MAG TPA: valine--tRNA ligase [Abditibacterium sp.]|jgi:valyl-tRNA synthetase